jgi:hypothetical protein
MSLKLGLYKVYAKNLSQCSEMVARFYGGSRRTSYLIYTIASFHGKNNGSISEVLLRANLITELIDSAFGGGKVLSRRSIDRIIAIGRDLGSSAVGIEYLSGVALAMLFVTGSPSLAFPKGFFESVIAPTPVTIAAHELSVPLKIYFWLLMPDVGCFG